ncbi:hypothetical protein A2291_05535 [candidate division WOR-1 bacterium RIFOXYB2_FULL_42_35]|uniref:Uncharacterized protein n=1 Tax=candidate division WOR-1 bacterium RIFOXYC2_FULL_41_25 TaxID=1802586 RepID=A0A1F4TNU6_UNCSA|nr:MAG: hypothetical protein A2247_00305 [candidate division WOR-1 bacterium RIFOXYA2_FULL_41_14]OGC24799.1 MAG: hypothetical protein A2291_05535 [candidate division WOR-1 bacterium RIFOXYB2_FULL_42_35]OGC34358.1 MAG: hypothetical protein A2462_07865 [candidate division WOR-1 bacterium RIFOXYC2_FULL_41_25]OGC43030.1 MAG: hypothetical protein A2548_07350 [candidate division WOR-1 bacterium RIFOXYD2_FULL_41_8]
MKKIAIVAMTLILGASLVVGVETLDLEGETVSIKAGPTQPGENLSLLWLEAFVSPKTVKQERILNLGVRVTSKVEGVSATFDFAPKGLTLDSTDGLNWSANYIIPDGVANGLHIVKYDIAGKRGTIQRTVDFFSETIPAQDVKLVKQVDSEEGQAWPLTVSSTASALVVDGSSLKILPGAMVVGLAKVSWYKVLFEDGRQGWIAAANVSEPMDEYCALGYEAYTNKDYALAVEYYKNTVAMEPKFVKGHYWLAKCYAKAGNLDAAHDSIIEAIRLDDRDVDSKVFAGLLAKKFFDLGYAKFRAKRFNEAVTAYQKVIDLKPTSLVSWIEMGQSYKNLGFTDKARSAWKAALGVDPDNREVYALLGVDSRSVALLELDNKQITFPKTVAKLPPSLADDSLQIVKSGKTNKGTKIESALKSVITLTKSLGSPVVEKGWKIAKQGKNVVVRYVCEQERGVLESFDWLVDIDTKNVSASNDNARLIMNRW